MESNNSCMAALDWWNVTYHSVNIVKAVVHFNVSERGHIHSYRCVLVT